MYWLLRHTFFPIGSRFCLDLVLMFVKAYEF
ncbi:hypothetical protein G5O_0823 [Chlamydia psittaci 6BC]|nr:hypothetical protein G5O_0823 [Chlamydia psittaci 6BC]